MRFWTSPPLRWVHAVPWVLGLLLGLAPARAQDPFAPGLRWTRAADPARSWIPRSVALGADDNLAWTACSGPGGRLELLSAHALGTALPLSTDTGVASSTGSLAVAAGSATDVFFSVAQFPQPDAQHRRTLIERRAPTGAAAWSYDPGFVTNGPARIACDASGSRAVVAVWNSQTSRVEIDRLDGPSGSLLSSASLAAASLNALAVSADGTRAAVAAGLDLWVVAADGSVLHHSTLPSSTQALALSRDGRKLAVGDVGRLRVLADGGGGYTTALTLPAPASEMAVRASLSDDGVTLAIGWWNFVTGVGARYEVWDAGTGVRLVEISQYGVLGGLQNFPEAARVTPDGRRIAFGGWGDGTPKPEVVLVDRATRARVLQVDLPGSVMGLALDASGTRIAVAMKDVHANQLGSTGEVRLYDTGERDLAVVGQPSVGATLDLAAKRPGATICFFLLGTRSPLPIHVAGATGELLLVRGRMRVVPRPCDATGRADVSLPLPGDPSLVGTEMHAQAAFRVSGVLAFGSTVVDPLVL